MLVAAIPWGVDGALSAGLGGAVNVLAGAAYGLLVSRGKARSAGDTIRTMLRAEAVKVLLIVVLLWQAMVNYRAIVHAAFFGSFVVTVVIFASAITVRDEKNASGPGEPG